MSFPRYYVGNLLNVKPICEVKDGLVTQLGQVRGKKNVINKLIEATDELTGGNIDTSIMYIGYMDNEKEKDKMMQIKAGAMDDLLTGRIRLTRQGG